jgi:two-component system heavy metal sensor histidine kinase CusS
MAEKAADITPARLSTRLPETDAPLELRQFASSFNAMLDRLADGYDHLSQFSADLAHEIRTPIGAMIGQTQVALGQVRSADEYQGVLESNLEELDRLSHMVDNMLFLAHADHAGLSIDKSSLNLNEELGKIAEYFEGLADERQLSFEVEANGTVLANPMLWRRAVSNLVVNAVRYAAPGTVARLIGHADSSGAHVIVENEGLPIPPQHLERLFDRFYRGDVARSKSTESNGLGLSIVRAIMTLHSGTASVSCTPGGHVRFTLDFPHPG